MTAGADCLRALRVLGHEMRRPLTVIRGAATLLVDDGEELPVAERRQMTRLIETGVDAMSDLIDDLLTAVHLDLGDLHLVVEPVDLAAVLEEAVAAVRRREPDRHIDVAASTGLEVEADRGQALRALRAVLANAVSYSPPASRVEVVVHREPAGARVEVLDRGEGIPPEQRERAFEKFVRLDERAGGAGLGLFLARGLARAMGGDAGVAGRAGGGSAVWVTLSRRV